VQRLVIFLIKEDLSMTDGQKLVSFLDRMMVDSSCAPIDHTIEKDATQKEINGEITACPKCGAQILDPFGSGEIIHNIDECLGE
jgi:hypothetical protein